VTFTGDDMNSKGAISPLARAPGSNTLRAPSHVSEELVSRLSQMYQSIKEERTETRNEKGEVTSWKDEGEWTKSKAKKDGRGKVTNLSDKARRESEKLSKKEKEVAEASHQEKTTMKHVKNPTDAEKKAAKDIKPGIAGYKDRVDMLKSAEKDDRLDESVAQMLALNKRLNG
jgi:chromosome segregation ATPase